MKDPSGTHPAPAPAPAAKQSDGHGDWIDYSDAPATDRDAEIAAGIGEMAKVDGINKAVVAIEAELRAAYQAGIDDAAKVAESGRLDLNSCAEFAAAIRALAAPAAKAGTE